MSKEIAKRYNIPSLRNINHRRYTLDNVYKYKRDASKRAKGLRDRPNPFYSRVYKIVKPDAIPKTYHYAVYISPKKR